MNDEIKCPKCGSTNWRCWDERIEYFADENGEYYDAPVGYLACKDCGKAYTHHHETNEHIGTHEDAYGYE